jgi:subtilisin family serine protease/subtilisin-like proprotein convertase family protein
VEPLEARAVPAQLAVDAAAFDTSHVLVRWKDGLVHPSYGLGARPLGNGLFAVNIPKTMSVELALAAFRARPGLQFAQPDYRVTLDRTPDDPSAGSLWGLDAVSAPAAWNTGTGTGRTIVAVIDSGIAYNHPDLKDNIWRNPGEIAGNGIDDDRDGFVDDVVGWDFANGDSNPMDDNGHGTHVAGTIGAVGDNGVGVAGVAWHTKVMALKFLDSSGSGYLSNAVRALNFAVAHGARVVNASFGGGGYDAAMATALANARAHGVIVVAAAGNDGTDNDANPVYPANYAGDNLVAVAATDRADKLASFSNYGRTTVDVAAPGVSIYSTLPNGKYGTYSGTSMATPHVAGAMALVWDAHSTWTYKQVIAAVLNTADRLSTLNGKVATGRLNVAKAVAYNPGGTTPPPAADTTGATVTDVTFSGTGSAIGKARVTFSEAIDPATFTAGDVTLTAPGGKAVAVSGVTAVTGSGNTQFDVTFPAQAATGSYALTVGPDVRDPAGNPMDQNKNGKPGESADRYTATTTVAGTRTYNSADVGKAIPDFGQVVSRITVTDDVTIRDLNVQVLASHGYTGDVRMTLVGPDGTRVVLFNRRGGSGNDFANAVFDDEAADSIWRGVAPFAGSYKPEYVLSAFDGKSAKGTWSLVIDDLSPFDSGKLWGWSVTVQAAPAATAAGIASLFVPV